MFCIVLLATFVFARIWVSTRRRLRNDNELRLTNAAKHFVADGFVQRQ
jgi:hypothetical protein